MNITQSPIHFKVVGPENYGEQRMSYGAPHKQLCEQQEDI